MIVTKNTKVMTSDSSPQAQDSSLPNPTVVSLRFESVLRLGQRIVDELKVDQSFDTLSDWMAHHIAELMQAAESAEGDERLTKSTQCASAILDLWKHRRQFPHGKRPFEDFDPIVGALESLNPADATPRYFRPSRLEANESEQNAETKRWLQAADGLDYSARILIRYFLACAAKTASDKSKEWVKLADSAGAGDDLELHVIRILSEEGNLTTTTELDDKGRKDIEDRIARLEGFEKMASALALDFKKQLNAVDEQRVTSAKPKPRRKKRSQSHA